MIGMASHVHLHLPNQSVTRVLFAALVLITCCCDCTPSSSSSSLSSPRYSSSSTQSSVPSDLRPQADSTASERERQVYNIGAVLSSPNNIVFFLHQIEVAQMWLPGHTELVAHTVVMNANPIRTAQAVCDLISRQVYVVIVSHPIQAETSPASVSFTCGFYNIPVIGISNRDSSLSNKNLHASFMRTIPPYSHQADVWIEILKDLDYQSVVFIHSSDNDGRSTLTRFQNMADAAKVKVETIIEYEPGLTNIADELNRTKQALVCRVYILYANSDDAEAIFTEIVSLNMTSPGYVWLVSEQALKAPNKPDGLLGLVLKSSNNEEAHISDSLKVTTMALRDMLNDPNAVNVTKPPSDCSEASSAKWEFGVKLLKKLKNQTVSDGQTGRVAFDDNGDRLDAEYEVVNVVTGHLVSVGVYLYSKELTQMVLKLDVSTIEWPGGERHKPLGYYVATHLKVVTIEEKPFVWVLPTQEDGSCSEPAVYCPKQGHRGQMRPACCQGYCIDLLKALSHRLNFTYELYQVADGYYGAYEYKEDGKRKWNGLIGDLVERRADMAIAPLSINPERAKMIDFSKPFKFQGIAMIQKRKPRAKKMESFLQPFKIELWALVFVSVFIVATVLYVLDRFSPFGRNMLQDTRMVPEKSLNFSSAIWFSWGVLLNSGIGEKTPMSFSARVLGMVWAGFSMIVVASYTANLAAWLVLDTTETEITGLDDSRLRNPIEGFRYGTVKGSYVDMYFSGQVELSNMYRLMEEYNARTAEEALMAVKTGDLNVFFWDSPRLEYEAALDCNLVISGETFARSGYGLGLQKHSFWSERVTLQVLGMHESGLMESLDNKWILGGHSQSDKACPDKMSHHFQDTLGMETMSDVFMLVAGGMFAGFGLILVEVAYKKRRNRKIRQIAAAKKAAYKWRSFVQRRRLQRHDILALPYKPMDMGNYRSHGQANCTISGGQYMDAHYNPVAQFGNTSTLLKNNHPPPPLLHYRPEGQQLPIYTIDRSTEMSVDRNYVSSAGNFKRSATPPSTVANCPAPYSRRHVVSRDNAGPPATVGFERRADYPFSPSALQPSLSLYHTSNQPSNQPRSSSSLSRAHANIDPSLPLDIPPPPPPPVGRPCSASPRPPASLVASSTVNSAQPPPSGYPNRTPRGQKRGNLIA